MRLRGVFGRTAFGTAQRRARHRVSRWVRRFTAPMRVLPDFLIAGTMKGGTTALKQYLAQIPSIVVAQREVHYFDTRYGRGTLWYRSHFPLRRGPNDPRIVGEKSPSYLVFPHTARRIADLLPDARIVVLLRDPSRRALSHYFHEVKNGNEELGLCEAMRAEEERLDGEWARLCADPTYYSPTFPRFSYKKRGLYAEQLERFFEAMDRSQILVLSSEELRADPSAGVADVCRHIGYPGSLAGIEYGLRHTGRYSAEGNRDVMAYLDHYFEPHNERLFTLLGRRFPWGVERC